MQDIVNSKAVPQGLLDGHIAYMLPRFRHFLPYEYNTFFINFLFTDFNHPAIVTTFYFILVVFCVIKD